MTSEAPREPPGPAPPAEMSAAAQPRRRWGAQVAEPIRCDPHPGFLRWLLHLLYDGLGIVGILVSSPWWLWRSARGPEFRAMILERLGRGLPRLGSPGAGWRRVLVHGVSVGEIKSAVTLVRQLEERDPHTEVVLSTTTGTGLAMARQLYPGHRVVRFPFDLTWICRRFLRHLAPDCIVLVELEIWPNFLRECNRAGIPVAVVNGRITADSFASYRVFKSLLPQFNRISLFCAQQEEYAARFLELCDDEARILVTGNLKVDGLEVGPLPEDPELRRLIGGAPEQPVIVAGSTHHPEEREVVLAWRSGAPQARLILVPRHPQRASQVAGELAAIGHPPERLTELRREPPTAPQRTDSPARTAARPGADPKRPVLVDTIGELERIYALADLVFVGGSLIPHGGQNMLEAAARARPVLYGPHVANFRQEAAFLEAAGASLRVADAEELGRAFRDLLADPERRARMSSAGARAVLAERGATQLTVEALEERCLARDRAAGPAPDPELDPEPDPKPDPE